MSTLFVLGNMNEHTFGNSIVAADQKSSALFGEHLSDIFVLHSPESHASLNAKTGWVAHLLAHNICPDIITHRTIDISSSDTAIIRFARYMETAITSSGDGRLLVDLTNGITLYKNLLSTVAYILDIRNLYMIDTARLPRQAGPIEFLSPDALVDIYVNTPDVTYLDSIAYLSLTEVLRYRRVVSAHTKEI